MASSATGNCLSPRLDRLLDAAAEAARRRAREEIADRGQASAGGADAPPDRTTGGAGHPGGGRAGAPDHAGRDAREPRRDGHRCDHIGRAIGHDADARRLTIVYAERDRHQSTEQGGHRRSVLGARCAATGTARPPPSSTGHGPQRRGEHGPTSRERTGRERALGDWTQVDRTDRGRLAPDRQRGDRIASLHGAARTIDRLRLHLRELGSLEGEPSPETAQRMDSAVERGLALIRHTRRAIQVPGLTVEDLREQLAALTELEERHHQARARIAGDIRRRLDALDAVPPPSEEELADPRRAAQAFGRLTGDADAAAALAAAATRARPEFLVALRVFVRIADGARRAIDTRVREPAVGAPVVAGIGAPWLRYASIPRIEASAARLAALAKAAARATDPTAALLAALPDALLPEIGLMPATATTATTEGANAIALPAPAVLDARLASVALAHLRTLNELAADPPLAAEVTRHLLAGDIRRWRRHEGSDARAVLPLTRRARLAWERALLREIRPFIAAGSSGRTVAELPGAPGAAPNPARGSVHRRPAMAGFGGYTTREADGPELLSLSLGPGRRRWWTERDAARAAAEALSSGAIRAIVARSPDGRCGVSWLRLQPSASGRPMLSLEASSTSAELSMVDEELRRATVAHALAKAQVARLPLTLPRSDRSHLASFGQESRAEYRTPRCPPPGIWAAECPDPPARLALHELMLSPGWSEAPASRIVVEPKSWLARLLGV